VPIDIKSPVPVVPIDQKSVYAFKSVVILTHKDTLRTDVDIPAEVSVIFSEAGVSKRIAIVEIPFY